MEQGGWIVTFGDTASVCVQSLNKLGIAQKETGETLYWLELLCATHYLSEPQFRSLYGDTEEVMKLLRSSILTKKKNLAAKISLTLLTLLPLAHFI